MSDVEKNIDTAPAKEEAKKDAEEVLDDATWTEVFQSCCVHSAGEWGLIFVGMVLVCFFLYFFLFGLDLIGNGAKVMGGCTAGELFGDDTNPVAGLMVGIIATVLLQSSSTTTSIVVALVGAGSVSVNQGIYMVMGANIGTSVTNTIVAMGQMGNGDQLERAFAGATVHDMFNFLTVAIFFPFELITGYLYRLTKACVGNFEAKDGDKWVGPVKKLVSPLTKKVIIANKNVIKGVAKGDSCSDFYPIVCEDPDAPTKATCSQVGLIACDKKTGLCPAFFDATATRGDDQTTGVVVFILGLVILFICLFGLVKILQRMLLGSSTRIIHKATNINGYLAIAVGAGITMILQSSSITTSTFTPLVGMDVIQLEQMFPITLGANIGTTLTALLAAMLSTTEAMQVALAHLFFNISGIIVWYPVPFMRNVPLNLSRNLGKATRIWRGIPIVYILTVFLAIPLLLLGLSLLYTQGSIGLTALGGILTVALIFGIAFVTYWFVKADGKAKTIAKMESMQKRRAALQTLPEDISDLKAKILALEERTGLLPEEAPTEKEGSDEVEESA